MLHRTRPRVAGDAASADDPHRHQQRRCEALEAGGLTAHSDERDAHALRPALFLAGDTAAAVRALQQATSRFPVEPLAYRYLAEAAARTRDSALAHDADLQYAALTGP